MKNEFWFENIEQFETFEDPLRYEIIRMLIEKPMTGAQIARRFGIDRHRIYYHLNLLIKHRLIEFVEQKTLGGVVERYYRAVALLYRDTDFVNQHRLANANSKVTLRAIKALRALLAFQLKSFERDVTELNPEEEKITPSDNWDYRARLTIEEAAMIVREMEQVLDHIIALDQKNSRLESTGKTYNFRGICVLTRIADLDNG
jgi:DNA-binding transcriptional ArsR family regulator